MVKIFQGSVVTQTTLGGLTIHPPIANFLQCICAKNYENWMTVGKVLPFGTRGSRNYAPPCINDAQLSPFSYDNGTRTCHNNLGMFPID